MKTWMLTTLGAALGGLAGWSWWYFFGCTNGCAITSSPVNSSLYGAFMGALLLRSFKKSGSSAAQQNN